MKTDRRDVISDTTEINDTSNRLYCKITNTDVRQLNVSCKNDSYHMYNHEDKMVTVTNIGVHDCQSLKYHTN